MKDNWPLLRGGHVPAEQQVGGWGGKGEIDWGGGGGEEVEPTGIQECKPTVFGRWYLDFSNSNFSVI